MESVLKPRPAYKVRWTETALKYLEAAVLYVAEDSPPAAKNLATRIYIGVQILSEHPEIGRPGRCKGTRELVISGTPYVIPYRIKGDQVEILRVLHGARKWPLNL
ncbi:MAG TPA: type II toxin-antitoxin system RelE/ParE family toxin [bacterium]|nr:type II toxin-antitoxin system RelE/ParE family toxin [bacterium]